MPSISLPFEGRKRELARLNDLLKKKVSSLVVIKGRRRVGKSRLIEEFAEGKTFYKFTGLAPVDGITAQSQRDQFALELSHQTELPNMIADDWSKLFSLLALQIKTGPIILCFDEISWMAHDDPTFLPKLKTMWDDHYKKNPQLIFILCGSISTWIEENIISSTGYFGRIAEKITLRELSLKSCNQLLEAVGFKRSRMEKLMLLSLTGGVPWYIELINPSYSASENIKRLCFEPDAILAEEHDRIFKDLFGNRTEIYGNITRYLASKCGGLNDIANGINYSRSGVLKRYLNTLVITGYITVAHQWSFKTGKITKSLIYRISDNYLRFYYKYIEPRRDQIASGQYSEMNITNMPSWNTMMGLQFENLVLQNRSIIFQHLHIRPEDIVNSNPYIQTKTARRRGCQIDLLIQTRFNTLFVCEIKFSKNPVNSSVIDEVKEKIKRLRIPKSFSCIPVLIYVNGVSEEVLEAGYFIECIDLGELLDAA